MGIPFLKTLHACLLSYENSNQKLYFLFLLYNAAFMILVDSSSVKIGLIVAKSIIFLPSYIPTIYPCLKLQNPKHMILS